MHEAFNQNETTESRNRDRKLISCPQRDACVVSRREIPISDIFRTQRFVGQGFSPPASGMRLPRGLKKGGQKKAREQDDLAGPERSFWAKALGLRVLQGRPRIHTSFFELSASSRLCRKALDTRETASKPLHIECGRTLGLPVLCCNSSGFELAGSDLRLQGHASVFLRRGVINSRTDDKLCVAM